ncbi:FHA domain-containing protein [Nitrospirillum sp. BR 11752]|uniref:FHA domain-containing protein n=1 Tax=Nitrospirillum sp. BR 11752 TaxID=3104293 RepID=UPI003FA5E889
MAGDCSVSEGETRVCDGGSFTIGRGAENDWVVSDPQRHLSKQHCRIELRGQTYFVIDTSTNGVYVGGASSPLGRGNAQPVNDGDVINLGPCSLRLEIGEQPASSALGHPLGAAAHPGLAQGGLSAPDPDMEYGLEGLNGARTGYVPSLTQVLAGDRVGEMQLTDILGEGEAEVEPPFGGRWPRRWPPIREPAPISRRRRSSIRSSPWTGRLKAPMVPAFRVSWRPSARPSSRRRSPGRAVARPRRACRCPRRLARRRAMPCRSPRPPAPAPPSFRSTRPPRRGPMRSRPRRSPRRPLRCRWAVPRRVRRHPWAP